MGIRPESVKDDVLVAAYLLESTRSNYPIPFLAQIYADIDAVHKVPDGFDEAAFRTAEEADLIARLAPILRKKIHESELEKVYAEIELPLIPVLADIELVGMKVDGESLKTFSEFISKELETLKDKILKIAGREFNIGSPKQVGEIFGELNIETGRKTATGQISTSHDVLVELAETYEIAQLIIDYRELDKLRATYADALPKMIAERRPHSRLSQSNGRRDRPPQLDRAESAKHSGPHGAGSANSQSVYSRKRQQADLGRLFAARACESSLTSPRTRECSRRLRITRTSTPKPRGSFSVRRPKKR